MANTKQASPFGDVTKAQGEAIEALTPAQNDALALIAALPTNARMSVVANTLGANGKVMRGWLRSVRKVSVSGHAAGCERQALNLDDRIALVKRFVKTDEA